MLRRNPVKNLQQKLKKLNGGIIPDVERQILYLNIIWILTSFTLLYYGLSGNGQQLYNSFLFMIYFFLLFWYLGEREKQKYYENILMGDKAKGQWDR